MADARVRQSIIIAAPIERAFDVAVSIDPVALVRPHGFVPGVAAFEGARRWSQPVDERRLVLTDGNRLTERLVAIDKPGSASGRFAYQVVGFGGWFARMTDACDSEWLFEPAGATPTSARKTEELETRATWSVVFREAGPLGALLPLVVKPLWPGYMRAALTRLKQTVEPND